MNPATAVSLAGSATQLIGGVPLAQTPIVKMAAKYWWLSIPAGVVIWGKIAERSEKGKMKPHHYITAAAEGLGPVLTFVALFELAERLESKGKLGPTQKDYHSFSEPAMTQQTPPPSQQRTT